MVALTVHSALDAAGFLARISTAPTVYGIACNVVSAFHHDHLSVHRDRLDGAPRALVALARVG